MKKIIIITLALLLVGCANKGTKVRLYTSEVCVWRNGNWTTDWMQKYVEYVRGNDDFYTDERIMDTTMCQDAKIRHRRAWVAPILLSLREIAV